MSGFNTNTDHTRNMHTDSIVYQDAFGNAIEVTLEQFLADDPANTPAKFLEFKAFSDGIFAVEDKDARIRSKKEIPLYEWADAFASESLEAQLVERTEHEAHQAYLRRRKELRALLPEASMGLFKQRVIIPDMQVKLKQGDGRAIRTEKDTACCAILDIRAGERKPYRNYVLSALPKSKVTSSIEAVRDFFVEKKSTAYFLPKNQL